MGLEAAKLVRSGVWRGEGVTDGRGQPVLLIPGFLAGDGSLSMLTHWLRRSGYHTRKAGIRVNVDCSGRALARLEQLSGGAGRAPGPPGDHHRPEPRRHLRQGARADPPRAGGRCRQPRHPAGRPAGGPPAGAPAGGGRGDRRQPADPHLFSRSCIGGDCCETFWEHLAAPLDASIGYLAIYSKTDGVVDWGPAWTPAPSTWRSSSSHCGMGMNPGAYRGIADALTALPPRRRGQGPRAQARAPHGSPHRSVRPRRDHALGMGFVSLPVRLARTLHSRWLRMGDCRA